MCDAAQGEVGEPTIVTTADDNEIGPAGPGGPGFYDDPGGYRKIVGRDQCCVLRRSCPRRNFSNTLAVDPRQKRPADFSLGRHGVSQRRWGREGSPLGHGRGAKPHRLSGKSRKPTIYDAPSEYDKVGVPKSFAVIEKRNDLGGNSDQE